MQRILYVEDDAGSRKVMQYLVRDLGADYELIAFDHSRDFLDKVRDLAPQPSIIMLDIHIEPIDGFEMLRQLRESGEYNHLPIVALTASVMNEEVQTLRKAGFDGVLAKPLNPDLFADQFRRILAGEQIWTVGG